MPQAGLPDWLQLLSFLGRRGIPCVLPGTSAQLRAAAWHSANRLHLLLPAEPEEITEGVQLLIGPPSTQGLPSVIDLGAVRILLFVYSLGLGVPFLIAALGFGVMGRFPALRTRFRLFELVGGGLLVVIGVLLASGWWDGLLSHLRVCAGSVNPPL